MKKRIDVLNKLRNVAGRLQLIEKEISSMNVPGLELTREDLGIRRKKPKDVMHGQKQHKYKFRRNLTTPTSGQGEFPFGISQ